MSHGTTYPYSADVCDRGPLDKRALISRCITLKQIETCAYVLTDVENEMRFGEASFKDFSARRHEMRQAKHDILRIGWTDGTVSEIEVCDGEPPLTACQFVEHYISCFASFEFEVASA